jgi:hypothetical protein
MFIDLLGMVDGYGIEIPGIKFQNQKMNDEMMQYNNKLDNNRIRTTGGKQL